MARGDVEDEGVVLVLEGRDFGGSHRDDRAGLDEIRVLVDGVLEVRRRAALVQHAGRGVVPVVPGGEPHAARGQAGDLVHGRADGGGEDVVAEEEFLLPAVGILLFRIFIIERAAHGNACVIGLPRRAVDVRGEVVAEPDGPPHRVEMVREDPEALLHRGVLGRVGLEDRGEDAALEPARVEFGVGFLHPRGLHMAADVVAPVAVADVGGGGGEPGEAGEDLPTGLRVAGEADLVAVAADAAPAVIDHRPAGVGTLVRALADDVVEEGVVEPEGVGEAFGVFAEPPLLPVEPPEIDALPLEGTDDGIEVGVGPGFLVDAERDRGLGAVLLDVPLGSVVVGSP